MSVTSFLSLWISNVASASMLLPIVIAMVNELACLDKAFSNGILELVSNDNKSKGKFSSFL